MGLGLGLGLAPREAPGKEEGGRVAVHHETTTRPLARPHLVRGRGRVRGGVRVRVRGRVRVRVDGGG